MTGAKKPVAKMATTKSRGSNTAKQVGDMNQRETYNASRDGNTRGSNSRGTGAKVTKAEASQKSQRIGTPNKSRPGKVMMGIEREAYLAQRAGGSKNLSSKEIKAASARKSNPKAAAKGKGSRGR